MSQSLPAAAAAPAHLQPLPRLCEPPAPSGRFTRCAEWVSDVEHKGGLHKVASRIVRYIIFIAGIFIFPLMIFYNQMTQKMAARDVKRLWGEGAVADRRKLETWQGEVQKPFALLQQENAGLKRAAPCTHPPSRLTHRRASVGPSPLRDQQVHQQRFRLLQVPDELEKILNKVTAGQGGLALEQLIQGLEPEQQTLLFNVVDRVQRSRPPFDGRKRPDIKDQKQPAA